MRLAVTVRNCVRLAILPILAAGLAGCDDEDIGSSGDADVSGDAATEVGDTGAGDMAGDPDTGGDAGDADAAPDAAPDLAPDVEPDLAPDLPGEDAADAAPDADDVGPDGADAIAEDLVDADAPPDADCEGWRWDGERCLEVAACPCVGAGCDALYETREACEVDNAADFLAAREYTLVVFDPPGDNGYALPKATTDEGLIVGSMGPEPFSAQAAPMTLQLPDGPIEALEVTEASLGYAHGVNEQGVIVGENLWTPQIWIEGERSPLDVIEGWGSGVARDISDTGLIVGSYADYDDPLGDPGPRPAYWPSAEGDMTELPLVAVDSDPNGYALGINAAGAVVGWLEAAGAVVWPSFGGAPVVLELAEGAISQEPYGLNEVGDVVGRAVVGETASQAFLYRGEDKSSGLLPYLPDATGEFIYAEAQDIDDHGVIVGTSTAAVGGPRAVVWFGGEVLELEDAVADLPEGVRYIIAAHTIDNSGRIAVEVVLDGVDVDLPRALGVLLPAE